MLKRRFYYTVKPFIPWRVRMGLRRRAATRILAQSHAVWPIDPLSAKVPDQWRGWPGQKRFALVLTHDVESSDGLEKVKPLAELEMSLGLRSSFNFIPEGSYKVPASLRSWLLENGFEVGVHDLHHDGKLYHSREEFASRATRINRYLREWGAVGYRSGFMMRNLDWHQDLEVLYDASTFDTDPFEPQPEGAGTIFPFWVSPNPNVVSRPGYVELPYTLPQDSTLFVLLREKTPDVWRRKLRWIADQGGMALLNTHPDYMNFGSEVHPRCFPVDYYADFLRHCLTEYRKDVWQVLPRDLAAWYRESVVKPTFHSSTNNTPLVTSKLKRKRAAVLLYSYYPADPRPRRAAEALVSEGMDVDVICLREGLQEAAKESVGGVNVRRLPMGKSRAGKLAYLWQYSRFICSCFVVVAWRTIWRRYDLVHVHNMPDVLAFSALPAKLGGARVILDQHDPMPELMTSIYGLASTHWFVGLLRSMERWSFAFVDQVITVNLACRRIFSSRSCAPEKIAVVMNSPNDAVFAFKPVGPSNVRRGPFVVMFHGSIVERHGLDLAVSAMKVLLARRPDSELRIYGRSNSYLQQVLSQAQSLGIGHAIKHLGSVDQIGIARAIDECHIGIIPNRRSIFTEINTPTRIFEYLARGKPVLAPNSGGITDYFGPNELAYFELGDLEDLSRQLVWAAENPEALKRIAELGQQVYLRHQWKNERERFVAIVTSLVASPRLEVGDPVPARQ